MSDSGQNQNFNPVSQAQAIPSPSPLGQFGHLPTNFQMFSAAPLSTPVATQSLPPAFGSGMQALSGQNQDLRLALEAQYGRNATQQVQQALAASLHSQQMPNQILQQYPWLHQPLHQHALQQQSNLQTMQQQSNLQTMQQPAMPRSSRHLLSQQSTGSLLADSSTPQTLPPQQPAQTKTATSKGKTPASKRPAIRSENWSLAETKWVRTCLQCLFPPDHEDMIDTLTFSLAGKRFRVL